LAKKIKKEDTQKLLQLVIDAILEVKGNDVISLDLQQIKDTVTDYFVIAHGDSNTQVNAIHNSILRMCKDAGFKPYHTEGSKNSEWIVIDFIDVVAHIFYRETRDFYQLEDLWSDAKITKYATEETIKPKAVRQPKKAVAEDDEEMLLALEAPVKKTGTAKRTSKAPAKKAVAPKKSTKAPAKKAAAPKAEKSVEKKVPAKNAIAKKK
jgi:ribosome-associated protein